MSDLCIGICIGTIPTLIAAVALIRVGRITVVVVRHSLLRPRGPDGRFLRDRDIAAGAALEAASRQTGGFGR